MTVLTPTPENIRAEMARYRLTREQVCAPIQMHPNALSNFAGGWRQMPKWAAHNIGYAINVVTGLMIFNVDMDRGVLAADPVLRREWGAHAVPGKSVRLPTPPRRRGRRKKAV